MENRVQFAYDFLFLARDFQVAENPENPDLVADATSKLFLFFWGLSSDEIEHANKLLIHDIEGNNCEDFHIISDRLFNHFREDFPLTERFLIQFSALSYIDLHLSKFEGTVLDHFRQRLDLPTADFNRLWKLGADLAIALDYFGKTFSQNRVID